ncbi:hypothetical protein OROGR_005029 [Orobanche gracilis]
MEKHHPDQTKVLSMNMSCCEHFRKILKKKLLKMHGVDSVSIDMENNLVLVTGRVDAMTLLNKVAKLGENVQLLPNDHHHSNNNHAERKHKNTRCRETVEDSTRRQKEKMQKEEHKCEPYEPPSVDARVCRDFFCKVHPRSRSIVDKVSGDRSSSFFGGFPTYGRGFGPSSGLYMDPMWYGDHPMPSLYGYDHQFPPQFGGHPSRMLPRPFNFR